MSEDNIIQIGKGADDGVLYNGVVDACFLPDGYIGAYDGIADVAARCNANGLNNNGILKLVLGGDSAAEFLQQFGVGFEKGLLFATVEPVLHLEGPEVDPAADHTFDGIGKVVFTIAGDMVTKIVLETVEEGVRFADPVDADQCHIGLRDLGFLHHPADAAVVFQLGNPEIAGIVDTFDTQQGLGLAEDVPDIIFADGVTQDNKYFVFAHDAAGKQDGVADALPLVLNYKMSRQLGIFLLDKVLDLFTKIAYNKDKLGDSGFHQLIYNNGENSLTR